MGYTLVQVEQRYFTMYTDAAFKVSIFNVHRSPVSSVLCEEKKMLST